MNALTATAALFGIALTLGLSPARAASPAPSTVSADPVARARDTVAEIQAGKLDRTGLTPDLNAALTTTALGALEDKLAPLGTPQAATLRASVDNGGVTAYTIRFAWPHATADLVFGIDDATAKIAKLYIVPGPSP